MSRPEAKVLKVSEVKKTVSEENSTMTWWQNYRYEQSKPRVKMNKEMILRTSVRIVFKEYMSNSSLCGVKFLVDDSKCKAEKIFWLAVVLFASAAVLTTLLFAWSDFVAKPIIVTLETHNYPIKNIPFPAIALCNVNRISKAAAHEYAKQIYPIPNHTFQGIVDQIYLFGRLLDFNSNDYSEMLPFIQHIYALPAQKSPKIKLLEPNCQDMLLRCAWGGVRYNCSELFTVRRTINGHCCCFNYLRRFDQHGRPFLTDKLKVQTIAGVRYGLNVLLDPMIYDYGYPLHNTLGFDVLIFDAVNYPDTASGRLSTRLISPDESVFIALESFSIQSTPEVRKYSAETRGCRFSDEMDSDYAGLYTYASCLTSCRMRTVQSLCNCIPFFLPVSIKESPTCTMFDLPCLDKFKEKLLYIYPFKRQGDEGLELELEDSLSCPECLPDCSYTRHATRAFSFLQQNRRDKTFFYKFRAGLDVNNMSFLSVYHENPETTLYRMDVVFYWFELLSNLGGVAGVWVGYSLVSVLELLYYLTFRFFFIIRQNRRIYS